MSKIECYYRDENLKKLNKYMDESDIRNFYINLFNYIKKLKDSHETLIKYIDENSQHLIFETKNEYTFIKEFRYSFSKKYDILKTIKSLLEKFLNEKAIFDFHYFEEIKKMKKIKNIDNNITDDLSDYDEAILIPISDLLKLSINKYKKYFYYLNKLLVKPVGFFTLEKTSKGLTTILKGIKKDLELYKIDIDSLYGFIYDILPSGYMFNIYKW